MTKTFEPIDTAKGRVPRGFEHIETWVFDLDNTLYPAGSDLWPKIDQRITAYVSHLLGIDGLSARALQKFWYVRHGTTLRALMDIYGIDPHAFLDFAHDIDRSSLAPNPVLGEAIASLPGRKLILTNGSRGHAERTAEQLGIREHFEDVFDIVDADFVPKPEGSTYRRFLDKHGIDPQRAAMFEDLVKNLREPAALGMTTVLVTSLDEEPDREIWEREKVVRPDIDWVTSDLPGFLVSILAKDRKPAA